MTHFDPDTQYYPYALPAMDRAKEAGGTLELLTLVGSRAYGTDNAESDWDWKGVYVASLPSVLSMGKAPGNITVADADTTLYELSPFCKLAAAANPTVLEMLWGEGFWNPIGEQLIANRRLFMSKRIEKTYGGYAMEQLRKVKANSGGSRGHNHYKRFKFRLHTLRLLDAGIHALKTGEVQVRHPDPERLLERATSFGGSDNALEQYVKQAFEYMNYLAGRSALPDAPDYDAINRMIYSIRTARPLQRDRTDPQSVGMFT